MQNAVVAHAKSMICGKICIRTSNSGMSCRHCYKLEDSRKSNLVSFSHHCELELLKSNPKPLGAAAYFTEY